MASCYCSLSLLTGDTTSGCSGGQEGGGILREEKGSRERRKNPREIAQESGGLKGCIGNLVGA